MPLLPLSFCRWKKATSKACCAVSNGRSFRQHILQICDLNVTHTHTQTSNINFDRKMCEHMQQTNFMNTDISLSKAWSELTSMCKQIRTLTIHDLHSDDTWMKEKQPFTQCLVDCYNNTTLQQHSHVFLPEKRTTFC